MSEYYDWNEALSYDAKVTMVVGARGIGKTYGLRLQFIRDYFNKGWRFLELTRYKNELPDFTGNYFQKIEQNNEFPGYIFKTTTRFAYIAKKPEKEGDKPDWKMIGYFGSLSQAQAMKKWTFVKVRRILLDEAIIDKRIDQFHNYLRNEHGALANIVDTVSRENNKRKKDESDEDFEKRMKEQVKPRVYLLGNACDLINPYFAAYGVNDIPQKGFTWHKRKTMILHYVEDSEYAKEKSENTVAGAMLADTLDELISSGNEFLTASDDFVMKKSKNAKFDFGLVYKNKKFGVWVDNREGYYYVNKQIPKNANPVFALTASDNRINYIAARKAEAVLKGFTELYYYGCLRYETPIIKEEFLEVLGLFGVR